MSALSAPLLATYASDEPVPMSEAIEETLTTAPDARASIGAKARTIWNAPITLTP